MVQLIALGLVGGLIWYAYNSLQKHMKNIGDELDKAEKKSAKASKGRKSAANKSDTDTLELGEDGVYRPKDDG